MTAYIRFPASMVYREYDAYGRVMVPGRCLEKTVNSQAEQEAFAREVEAMPENWQLETIIRALDEACEAARVLAAATLAGERPFLGMFGARDVLARTYSFETASVAGHVYLHAVQDGVNGGRIFTNDAGFIPASSVKKERDHA